MSLDLHTHENELRTQISSVLDGKLSWLILEYENNSDTICIYDSGDDGLEQMIDAFEPAKVMYGFCNVNTAGNAAAAAAAKFLFVNWQGTSANQTAKMKVNRHTLLIRRLVKVVHLCIDARSEDDLDPICIRKKLETSNLDNSLKAKPPKPLPEVKGQQQTGASEPQSRVELARSEINGRKTFWPQHCTQSTGERGATVTEPLMTTATTTTKINAADEIFALRQSAGNVAQFGAKLQQAADSTSKIGARYEKINPQEELKKLRSSKPAQSNVDFGETTSRLVFKKKTPVIPQRAERKSTVQQNENQSDLNSKIEVNYPKLIKENDKSNEITEKHEKEEEKEIIKIEKKDENNKIEKQNRKEIEELLNKKEEQKQKETEELLRKEEEKRIDKENEEKFQKEKENQIKNEIEEKRRREQEAEKIRNEEQIKQEEEKKQKEEEKRKQKEEEERKQKEEEERKRNKEEERKRKEEEERKRNEEEERKRKEEEERKRKEEEEEHKRQDEQLKEEERIRNKERIKQEEEKKRQEDENEHKRLLEQKRKEDEELKRQEEIQKNNRDEQKRIEKNEENTDENKGVNRFEVQTARVINEFQADESDELDLKVGEIIYNIQVLDENWWEGSNIKNQTGMFPAECVELIIPIKKKIWA